MDLVYFGLFSCSGRSPSSKRQRPLAPLAASSTLSYNSIYLQSNNNEIALQGHPYKINSAEISCTSEDLLFAFSGAVRCMGPDLPLGLAARRRLEAGAGRPPPPAPPRYPPGSSHTPLGRPIGMAFPGEPPQEGRRDPEPRTRVCIHAHMHTSMHTFAHMHTSVHTFTHTHESSGTASRPRVATLPRRGSAFGSKLQKCPESRNENHEARPEGRRGVGVRRGAIGRCRGSPQTPRRAGLSVGTSPGGRG